MNSAIPILEPRYRPEDVAQILKARETSPQQWQAPCPAHPDDGEHLAIGYHRSGALRLKCYAGCPFVEVIRALWALCPPEGAALCQPSQQTQD